MKDLSFGDIVHVDGNKAVCISKEGHEYVLCFEGTSYTDVVHECEIDEFKEEKDKEFYKKLVSVWRRQGIDFSHDDFHDPVSIYLIDIFDWMKENKEDIVKILNEQED